MCAVCVTGGSHDSVHSDGDVGVKAMGMCVSERTRERERMDRDRGER